jgi:hypothetical protein
MAMGAAQQGKALGLVDHRIAFQDSRPTLAGSLGRAGALEYDRASGQAAFVHRFERLSTRLRG